MQNAIAPISGMLVVGYLISLGGLTSPDSVLMRIASFVPPFAPLTLPARVILGQPGPWELPASLALMAASAYGLIHFGSLTYSGALLRFGGRVKLRHAYRSGLERARGTATRASLPPSPTPAERDLPSPGMP